MRSLQEIVSSCIEQIVVAPNLIGPYSEMFSNSSEYTVTEIKSALEEELISRNQFIEQNLSSDSFVEGRNGGSVVVETLDRRPLVYVDKGMEIPKLSGFSWGLSRRQHERKMNLFTQMRSIIYSSRYGISKTELLNKINKNNSHWRAKITQWLEDMVQEDILKKEGYRYFAPNISLENRERRLHRLVFESLNSNPLSVTAIAKRVGCDGGYNRKVVREIIEDLHKDGYVKAEGIRWRWVR